MHHAAMNSRPKSASRKVGPQSRAALVFACFSVVVVATGALSPHFAWGHLPISPALGQTVVIVVDFVLLLIGFRFYIVAVRRQERERRHAEQSLSSSFRYIGVANRKLEIFTQFVERLSVDDDAASIRDRIGSLLPEFAVSLLGADVALLRIIDRNSGRTVTEWRFSAMNQSTREQLRVRNREVLSISQHASLNHGMIVDRPERFTTVAVLKSNAGQVDESSERFLRSLVRYLHFIYAIEKPYENPHRSMQHETITK